MSRNDIIRYKLYMELKENGFKTLYSDTYIPREKLFTKEIDIEHIIPKAKLFDDSLSNKTLEIRQVNLDKRDMTALDFVSSYYDEKYTLQYTNRIENLYKQNAISEAKRNKLLMKEADIPSGFIKRDLRDSQYIAKKAREILEDIVRVVVPTTGSVTERLREDWQLVNVMRELNWDKYDKLGLTITEKGRDGQVIKTIKDWTKRNDHRHHAMDALTIAFTKHSFIQYLNNLNARVQKGVDEYINLEEVELSELDKEQRSSVMYAIEKKELCRDKNGKLRFIPPMPLDEFRAEAKRQLELVLVSNKTKNKVVTHNINKTKKKVGVKEKVQQTPRGQLHLETIYGSYKQPVTTEEKVNASFDIQKIQTVAKKSYRDALTKRLQQFGNDPKKAFTGKNSLEKNPIWVDDSHMWKVPEKVKTITYETIYTIRKEITPDLKIEKVIDKKIKSILQERLNKYGGDAKKAFSNLDDNPIWLNKEKGISIKRVKIRGISNGEPIRYKRNVKGVLIKDENGNPIPNDFVNTGNNHHVAVYKDSEGKMQERVVSFYEATTRAILGYPVVDRDYNQSEGWHFLFSMKQNEYFVFPNEKTGFVPQEIDLTDENNYSLISPNLYRVQKFSEGDYFFRHHLETTVESENVLRDVTWKRIRSIQNLEDIVKVRVNHLGKIISVGEY